MKIRLEIELGGQGTNLLLNVFTDLVVEFELLVNLLELVLLDVSGLEGIFVWWYGGREEVEE